jgi:hypothetical protein
MSATLDHIFRPLLNWSNYYPDTSPCGDVIYMSDERKTMWWWRITHDPFGLPYFLLDFLFLVALLPYQQASGKLVCGSSNWQRQLIRLHKQGKQKVKRVRGFKSRLLEKIIHFYIGGVNIRNSTQNLAHIRQILYHWAEILPHEKSNFLSSVFIVLPSCRPWRLKCS